MLGALVATGSSFVAKESGEALASRVGLPEDHAEIAELMPVFSGLMLIAVAALWWYDRGGDDRRTTMRTVLAVLTIITAVLALLWAVRAGHSGATAVWKPIVDNTTPGTLPERLGAGRQPELPGRRLLVKNVLPHSSPDDVSA